MDNLTETFCKTDDFCKEFEPIWEQKLLSQNPKKRKRNCKISMSEMITIVLLFHQLRYRQFKIFYLHHVAVYLKREFPDLPSYNRFIELLPRCVVPLAFLFNVVKGTCNGVSIADATSLAICDNKRISSNKVFNGIAARGKTTMGWFYGFKLHAVINSNGELLAIQLTPGNVDDRKPLPKLCEDIFGLLFADKGYIAKWLTEVLSDNGVKLITKVKKNMKPVEHTDFEKTILCRRSLIETVFDELKNLCQVEHTRHRSVANFIVNLLSGIVAYCLYDKKPSLSLIRNNNLATC